MKKSAVSPVDRFLQALFVAAALALCFFVYDAVRDKTVTVGDRAPSFEVTTNQGSAISARSFGGELLLLNFWATWCAPCIQEMPSLEQFHRTYQGEGVVVVGISVDRNPTAYENFLQRSGITFPNALDSAAGISSSFGTFRYPETYIIDRNGVILDKFTGAAEWTSQPVVDRILNHLRS
jgi:peroxiredoxin